MRFIHLLLIICLLVGVGLSIPRSEPVRAQNELPSFESAPCPTDLDYPDNREITCGYVTVLEDRADPGGNTIRLFVLQSTARFGETYPDPLVYLSGGPGGAASRLTPNLDFLFGPYNTTRDIILVDQRGTGYSEPNLSCEAFNLAVYEAYALPFSLEEGVDHAARALLGCYEDYVEQGVNVNAYTSASNAADLDDVRRALGIEQWNLYGISYGTRLALTTMRDQPDGIRSVIIDSVLPPQARLYVDTPHGAYAALNRLFELCAMDAECNRAYPDLERIFYAVVDRLNAVPLRTEVERPSDGEEYEMVVDGATFAGVFFFNMYATGAIPFMPYAIYAAYHEDYSFVVDFGLQGYFAYDGIATVMHYAVNCNEEIAFDTVDDIIGATAGINPRLLSFYDFDGFMTWEICEGWNAPPPDPIEALPVESEIPTLIFAGELDPVTPPVNALMAAETLPNSRVYIMPGGGHGVSFADECPRDIMRRFLADPNGPLDDSCTRAWDDWAFQIIEVDVD